MDELINFFVALHIIGIGALLGGFLTQMSAMRTGEVRIVPAMLHGALTMLATGVIMVGLHDMDHHEPKLDMIKIGAKIAVLVVILGLIWVNRDEKQVAKGVVGAIGGLTVVNILIATLWT